LEVWKLNGAVCPPLNKRVAILDDATHMTIFPWDQNVATHYYNSLFFQLGFLIKKFLKVTGVKKPPCQSRQVVLAMTCVTGQSNWTLSFWLTKWLMKWLIIWLVDNGPFDSVNFIFKFLKIGLLFLKLIGR
jgi:hypothetical protein